MSPVVLASSIAVGMYLVGTAGFTAVVLSGGRDETTPLALLVCLTWPVSLPIIWTCQIVGKALGR